MDFTVISDPLMHAQRIDNRVTPIGSSQSVSADYIFDIILYYIIHVTLDTGIGLQDWHSL